MRTAVVALGREAAHIGRKLDQEQVAEEMVVRTLRPREGKEEGMAGGPGLGEDTEVEVVDRTDLEAEQEWEPEVDKARPVPKHY